MLAGQHLQEEPVGFHQEPGVPLAPAPGLQGPKATIEVSLLGPKGVLTERADALGTKKTYLNGSFRTLKTGRGSKWHSRLLVKSYRLLLKMLASQHGQIPLMNRRKLLKRDQIEEKAEMPMSRILGSQS